MLQDARLWRPWGARYAEGQGPGWGFAIGMALPGNPEGHGYSAVCHKLCFNQS